MKFQKTLLAAALAVVGFNVQAKEATGTADAYKYQNKQGQELLKVTALEGSQSLIKEGWYQIETNNALKAYNGSTAGYTTLVSGGQIDILTKENSETNVENSQDSTTDAKSNVDQNNYWVYQNASTTTTTTTTEGESRYEITGQLVNYDENGKKTNTESAVRYEKIDVIAPIVKVEKTAATLKKDVQIGNLTKEQTQSNAKYDFTLNKSGDQVEGVVATIKTSNKANTSVAGVTGNGLAVLDVPTGGIVDLEKGTVTVQNKLSDAVQTPRTELESYKNADGKNIVQYDGKYYTLDIATKSLTSYEGDAKKLTKIGAGTAEQKVGGENISSVNTGLVSNKNVTYGESVTKSSNEGRVEIGSTNATTANDISGTDYILNESKKTVTSKDVVTGIIAEDKKGNKTYGLQATNIVDNKVTAQTTLTAEGIKTTGDVTIFAGSDKETTVGTFVESAAAAVDKKVDAAIKDVEVQVQQFSHTASRLNNRIDSVEEKAYSGVAIALAAQQQVPNIGAGQMAVFGGVGHYEGESAGALGLIGVLDDGRTSLSGAFGIAGSGDVGGRVGVAYVFGGK